MTNHRQLNKAIFETAAFAAFVTLDIWFGVRITPLAALLPLFWMVASWRAHARTASSLGLRAVNFVSAVRSWWPLWTASLLALFALLGARMFSWNSLRGALLYFLWSCLQQLTLQSMIYLPLRTALPPIKAAFFTGLIFAVVHAPNPVLVVGTLIWGMAAPLLFERWRSIWALGLAQVALSSLLLQLTPYRLNHGFRIGPFY